MQTIKRVLLVEDDIDDQMFFCEALTELHPAIDCKIANNGAEALEIVEGPPPFDMIFLDLNMPKVNGFDCLKRLKAHPLHKSIPVVIVSTSQSADDIAKSKLLGASQFISKTPKFKDLFIQLRNAINEVA